MGSRRRSADRRESQPKLELDGAHRAVGDLLASLLAGAVEEPRLDLVNTPARVARALRDELLSSYKAGAMEALHAEFRAFPAEGNHELMTIGPIPFSSMCAHHMLPFFGDAWVGYIPGDELAGLSKFARVVRFFSRKLQMQERMTSEIADFLQDKLSPKGLIVFTSARHMCMESRGVRSPGSLTRVSAVRGLALDNASVKSEFYSLIGVNHYR